MLNDRNTDLAKRMKAGAMAKGMQHLQKAGVAHAKGMDFLAKCGNMMGKAITVGGETLKAEDIMSHLSKAHEHFGDVGDHMEMAHAAFSKGASVEGGAETQDHVTDGGVMTGGARQFITGKTQSEMTEGEVPWYDADKPYAGKAAAGTYSKAEVDALLKAATAEAEKNGLKGELETIKALLSRTPAADQRRPVLFAVDKAGMLSNTDKGAGGQSPRELLLEGIDLHGIDADPARAMKAAGTMVNNMITNKDVFAKSVFDPSFKGKAGLAN